MMTVRLTPDLGGLFALVWWHSRMMARQHRRTVPFIVDYSETTDVHGEYHYSIQVVCCVAALAMIAVVVMHGVNQKA